MSAADDIIRALKELIVEVGVPYKNLPVHHICDRAGVSRKTFYAHFKSKDGIVDKIVHDEVVGPLFQISSVMSSLTADKAMQESLPRILNEMVYKAIAADKEFYYHLCNKLGQLDSPLVEALTKNIQELNEILLNEKHYSLPTWMREYISYYYAAGNAVMIQRWLIRGMKENPSELALLYNNMTTPFWVGLDKSE